MRKIGFPPNIDRLKLIAFLNLLVGLVVLPKANVNEDFNLNQGFFFGSCTFLNSDTVRFNPFDCGPFKIILVDTSSNSDSSILANIYVEGMVTIADTIFTKSFLDTFHLENDSAVNIYQEFSENYLFDNTYSSAGDIYFIRVEGGGHTDSIYVNYSNYDLGVELNKREINSEYGASFNLNGSKSKLNSRYLKFYFFEK